MNQKPTKSGNRQRRTRAADIAPILAGRNRGFLKALIRLAETAPKSPPSAHEIAELLILNGMFRLPAPEGLLEVQVPALEAELTANPEEVGTLIENVRNALEATVSGRELALPLDRIPAGSKVVLDTRPQHYVEGVGGNEYVATWWSTLRGRLRLTVPPEANFSQRAAAFHFAVMNALAAPEGVNVRRCQRESCGKFFLENRPTAMYCSRKCASAASVAFFRGRQTDASGRKSK